MKFLVPEDRRAALEQALRRGSVRRERLRSIYFDTADECLSRHAVALRLRQAGRRWVQTAKAATADTLRRLEHEVDVPAPRGEVPALDIARHDGTAAGDALRKALGSVNASGMGGNAAASPGLLRERFRTDVWRLTRIVRVAGGRVELALDVGELVAGESSQPVCEFELELKSGQPAALVDLAMRWAARHGLVLSTISKAERGARLARGESEGPAVKATALHVDAGAGRSGFLAAAIANCLGQVLANASELAAGAGDEEIVHQLRVGLRRLRTALRDLGAFGNGTLPAWEQMLRSTCRELGERRDLAIVVPAWRAELDAAGAPAWASPLPPTSARRPEAIVRDAAFQRVLLTLLAFCQGVPPAAAEGVGERDGGEPVSLRSGLAQVLDDLRRHVDRDAKRFAELTPDRQHRLRKRLKRLRYLCEFSAPVFGAKKVARHLAQWREAQDVLGEANDERIAAEFFRAHAGTEPRAWFAVGWLAARHAACIERCRRPLRSAARAKPFW